MICRNKCLKNLEAAFIVRSQSRHVENSYFQVRRDEIEEAREDSRQTRPAIREVTLKVERRCDDDDPFLEEDANINNSDEDFDPKGNQNSISQRRPANPRSFDENENIDQHIKSLRNTLKTDNEN
jgi:hypothetical protein